MTDDMTPDDIMAAEYALGLLEGEDLLEARARENRDPVFAAAVAKWSDQLAPLLDTIPSRTPRAEVWEQIAREMGTVGESAEIISLTARLRQWKIAAGSAAAAAVAAVSLMVLGPSQMSGPVTPEAPLAASIPIGDTQLRLAVTYLPERQELLVSASGLTADGVHDHELWLVPQSEGEPLYSLGVIVPGEERRVSLDANVAAEMTDGSALLLTREPLGGKPADADAGPVVAEGRMQII